MIVACRLLKLVGQDTEKQIEIRIFKPEWRAQGWWCDYEIDWPAGQWKSAGAGVIRFRPSVSLSRRSELKSTRVNITDLENYFGISPEMGMDFPFQKIFATCSLVTMRCMIKKPHAKCLMVRSAQLLLRTSNHEALECLTTPYYSPSPHRLRHKLRCPWL